VFQVYRCYRSDASLLTDLVRCQIVFGQLCDIDSFMTVRPRGHAAQCHEHIYGSLNHQELRKCDKCGFLDVLRVSVRVFDRAAAVTMSLKRRSECNYFSHAATTDQESL